MTYKTSIDMHTNTFRMGQIPKVGWRGPVVRGAGLDGAGFGVSLTCPALLQQVGAGGRR